MSTRSSVLFFRISFLFHGPFLYSFQYTGSLQFNSFQQLHPIKSEDIFTVICLFKKGEKLH